MNTYDFTEANDFRQLAASVARDIPTAIRDLETIRTDRNRDIVVWAQTILTACATIASTVIGKEVTV